jgi:hypothetical protein
MFRANGPLRLHRKAPCRRRELPRSLWTPAARVPLKARYAGVAPQDDGGAHRRRFGAWIGLRFFRRKRPTQTAMRR